MLTPGEIAIGQIITIFSWNEKRRSGGGLFHDSAIIEIENTDLCGDPMEVIAVGIPYVRVKMVGNSQHYVLDTRRVKLMELPREFAV